MVTIKDIAERAGVSTATVSNVIHNKTTKVSPERIKQIKKLLVEMGYQKEAIKPKEHQPRLVALLINSHKEHKYTIGRDPFYGEMIGAVESYLKKNGYNMLLYYSSSLDDIFNMVTSVELAGIIALTISKNDCAKIAHLTNKPIVSIDAFGDKTEIPNIGLDDWMGGYLMVNHLIQCGYNPIYVCAGRNQGVDHLRYEGGAAAVHEHNERASKDQVSYEFIPLGTENSKRERRLNEFLDHVTRNLEKQKAGLFFLSDLSGYEALYYLNKLGVDIPEQMGVAGFDDNFEAWFPLHGLTTIHQNIQRKGELAVEKIVSLIAGNTLMEDDNDLILPVKLVIRESTQKTDRT